MVTRLAGDKEGKGEGGKGDGDSDEGGGRRKDNGNGGKIDGNGDNGGGQAKRVMVMVAATRVGEGGGRQNRHWQGRQERWRRRQGWRASNSIQGNGKSNGDTMVRPTPTTTFDVWGGGGQQLPLSRAPRETLGGQRPGPCCTVP